MKILNYKELEELLDKHDFSISKSKTVIGTVFQKLFVIGSTIFMLLYGIALFIVLLPLVVIEGVIRGVKNAKKVSD